MLTDYLDLPYAYGIPSANGILKSSPEDFIVEEIPLFEPVGEGEHLFLYIEKRNCTSEQVAKDLAEICQVTVRDVSCAGLKDKQALTRQWFSVYCPGKYFPEINRERGENWTILSHNRHVKKLKTGTLAGNRFTLILRSIENPSEVEDKLLLIMQKGAPNYFTEQRFGNQGQNLLQAKRMLLEGRKVKNRFLAGLYLSAVRSYLFNRLLAVRVSEGTWQKIIPGDVVQLSDTKSVFVADEDLDALQKRLEQKDISPAAILWGKGRQLAQMDALKLQRDILEEFTSFLNAIELRKVERAYRSVIVHPRDLQWKWLEEKILRLQFSLPPGSYATAIVRELVNNSN